MVALSDKRKDRQNTHDLEDVKFHAVTIGLHHLQYGKVAEPSTSKELKLINGGSPVWSSFVSHLHGCNSCSKKNVAHVCFMHAHCKIAEAFEVGENTSFQLCGDACPSKWFEFEDSITRGQHPDLFGFTRTERVREVTFLQWHQGLLNPGPLY